MIKLLSQTHKNEIKPRYEKPSPRLWLVSLPTAKKEKLLSAVTMEETLRNVVMKEVN